ncbi:hypothetical protein MPTK2_3g90090P [Marchantia polymorpha subsp. ruderalis]
MMQSSKLWIVTKIVRHSSCCLRVWHHLCNSYVIAQKKGRVRTSQRL